MTILATSSDDLERAVAEGRFQSELFYALGAFTIRLPPLRERRGDIPLLVDHIIRHFAGIRQTLCSELTRVSEAALGILSRYDWPGNVDELQCLLKRALIEGKGAVLATENLARALGQAGATASVDRQGHAIDWSCFLQAELEAGSTSVYAHATAALERHLLPLALSACEGSQVKAAHCLGMTRGSLRKKLRQLGLLSTPGTGRRFGSG